MKYEVLKKEGFSGLTVGSAVLEPGRVFDENQWPYGKKALEAAVKNSRCKAIGDKAAAKKEDKPKDK